jgi:hypothetical protein
MAQQIADYEAIINPKRVVPGWAEHPVDCLSWILPTIAAICSVGSGVAALLNEDKWAAAFGIGGGFLAAMGVICTNLASRIRDQQLVDVRNTGALTMEMAQNALNRAPPSF